MLDFPANTESQRKWFCTVFEETYTSHTPYVVDKDDETCKQQLKERSRALPEGCAFTSDAEFDELSKYFQAPTEAEGFNIVRY